MVSGEKCIGRSETSDQFSNRLAGFHQRNWATGGIGPVCCRINTQMPEDGRGQIAGAEWTFLDRAALAVSRTNHLAAFDATSVESSRPR